MEASRDNIAKPLAAYSPARIVSLTPDVHLLYISGTTVREANGNIQPFGQVYDAAIADEVQEHDGKVLSAAAIQTDRILSKIDRVINDVSKKPVGLEALVELTIFVRDLKRDYAGINKTYDMLVGTIMRNKGLPLPARTCVEVAAMPPDERTLVEIKAVAKLETIRKME